MTPNDVADIRLIWPHSILVDEPFLDTGADSQDGRIAIITPYHDMLPKIFTTVLKAYKCSLVEEGDLVMFKAHHVLDYTTANKRRIWAMDERACLAVLLADGWKPVVSGSRPPGLNQ